MPLTIAEVAAIDPEPTSGPTELGLFVQVTPA
jgi:hypothetical protein